MSIQSKGLARESKHELDNAAGDQNNEGDKRQPQDPHKNGRGTDKNVIVVAMK